MFKDNTSFQTYQVPLVESAWQNLDRYGVKPVTRSDFLSTLSNIESILIRATVKEFSSRSSISDVELDTAVAQNTGQGLAEGLEQCRCPIGYRGTSCEVISFSFCYKKSGFCKKMFFLHIQSCERLYYRDSSDKQSSSLGACKVCPCQYAESCELGANRRVKCNCIQGYFGERCEKQGKLILFLTIY